MSVTDLTLPPGVPPVEAQRRLVAIHLPRNPKIIAGLVILAVFIVIAVIGGAIAPYSPDLTGPFCRTACSGAQAAQAWMRTFPVAGTGPGTGVVQQYYLLPLSPSGAHWLGTTYYATDAWSQLLASTQATLLVGVIAGAIATALSVLVGVSAGYLGGVADELLSLLANVFLAIPGLPLLIVLAGFVVASGNNGLTSNILVVALIVAVTGWAYGARVLRAQTLSLRSRDFVEAARVSGEGRFRIITVEVLPNLVPIVASSFLFTTLYAIGAYVALAFLGLAGAPGNGTGLWNWGEMMRQAFENNAIRAGWWWWWAPPGVCIALLGMSLALLNFGIDEFINPRLRAAGLTHKAARRARIGFRMRLGYTPVVGSPAPVHPRPLGGRGAARP